MGGDGPVIEWQLRNYLKIVEGRALGKCESERDCFSPPFLRQAQDRL